MHSTDGYPEVNSQRDNERFRNIYRYNISFARVHSERGGKVVYISNNLSIGQEEVALARFSCFMIPLSTFCFGKHLEESFS